MLYVSRLLFHRFPMRPYSPCATNDGKRSPVMIVSNSGDAHGRLDGSLEAKDASGLEFELVPDGTPILPGQTRMIGLAPKAEGKQKAAEPVYPIAAKGALDWDRGSFKITAEFRQ